MKPILVLLAIAIGAGCSRGETPRASDSASALAKDSVLQIGRTKLQAFNAKTGVVIIRGFSTVGIARGLYNTSVTVEARELTDAADGSKARGIAIEVAGGGEFERKETSYIDYDEIASLLAGLDYIAKLDTGVTRLANFQADYRTRGDFQISTFNASEGALMAAVRSGTIGAATAYFPVGRLSSIRDLITRSKTTLDSLTSSQGSAR